MPFHKDNATAHGSSGMIMENALIIDECFVSSMGFRMILSQLESARSDSPAPLNWRLVQESLV